MRKHRLLITVLSLCLCFSTFGFTGCSENKANVRVWSTYNTRKVMQSFGEYEDLGVKLDVLMAKGETEGAQLLITPDKRVCRFTVARVGGREQTDHARTRTVYKLQCV